MSGLIVCFLRGNIAPLGQGEDETIR